MFKFLQDLAKKFSGEEQKEEEELLAKDFSNYIERKADGELYNFIKASEVPQRFCYVLAPPQTGKTCLMKKTARRLAKEDYKCFQFRLKLSAKTFSESDFYLELLTKICEHLSKEGTNLVEILDKFWREAELQPPQKRFQNFLQEVFKKLVNSEVVIFIDNVQKLREWKINRSLLATINNLFQSGEESLQKLTFVLLGTDNPLDFFSDPSYASLGTEIKLENFGGNCEPLLAGLKNVSNDPGVLLDQILLQTGGQPFLTQSLCSLVTKGGRIDRDANLQVSLEELVQSTITGDLLDREQVKSHFQSIEDYFFGEPLENIDRKLYALNLYGRIADRKICELRENSSAQRDLLMSGLVRKTDKLLTAANPIYAQIFTQNWVEETQQKLKERRGYMPSKKIYNRKVYMLIDKSGSMARRDDLFNKERRWKGIAEALEGHVYNILNHQGMNGEKICDEVTMTFFSPNRPSSVFRPIFDDSDVLDLFEENQPDANTFVTPTFQKVVEEWMGTRSPNQGGFVIIYTDGALDDRDAFVNYIEATCRKLNSQDDLKVIIIGFGSDVNRDPSFYLRLDANARGFSDKNTNSCNIVVFDLLHKMPGIIQLLDSQLNNPEAGLPEWGREFCPELYG